MILLVGICLCLFFILFLLLNCLYKKTNDYKNTVIDIKNYENGIPENLQIVNLGSTYSKFAFSSLDGIYMNACDLSLQAQSLEMDYAILHKYMNHISIGGVVVVVVAACLLLYKEKGNNPLYYHILEYKENPCFTLFGKIKSLFPLLKNPRKIKKILLDVDRFYDVYDSVPINMSHEKSQEYINNLTNGWIKLFCLKDLKSTQLSDNNQKIIRQNIKYLKYIINLCIENHLRPVIVIPPFSDKLNCYFSDEFKEKIINESVKQAIGDRKIPFLNYQEDIRFQNRYELYVDGGFRLNKHGSRVFVNAMVDDLKKYGIYISNSSMKEGKLNATENKEETREKYNKTFDI